MTLPGPSYPPCLNSTQSYFPSGIFVEQTPRVTSSQFYQSYICPYAHTNQ